MAHVLTVPPRLPPRPNATISTKTARADATEVGVILNNSEHTNEEFAPESSLQQREATLLDLPVRACEAQLDDSVQKALYADLPIVPDQQIRILRLLPGELSDEVCCNLTVQDVDLKTRRVPPNHSQRDLIGDMLNLGFVDFFKKNVTKEAFVRDIKKWMPKTYQERER
jgi:hypothetical protein